MSLSHRYNISHTLLASPRLLTYKEDTNTSGGRTSSEKSTIRKWSISGYVCLWRSKEFRYCLIQSETRVRNSFSYPICYFTVLWMSNEKYDRLFRQNQDWIKIGCKIDAQAASCTINAPLDSSTGSDLGFIMIPGAQVRTNCSFKKNKRKTTIMRTSSDSWRAVRASGRRDPEAAAGSPFVDGGHLRLAWQLPQPGRDRRRRGRLPEQGARAGLARQRLHGRAQPGRHHVGDLDWGQPWPRSRFLLRHIIRREPLALQTMFCKVSFFLGRTFLTCLAPTRTSSKCLFSPLSESWTVSPSLLCSGCPYSLDQTGRRDFLWNHFFGQGVERIPGGGRLDRNAWSLPCPCHQRCEPWTGLITNSHLHWTLQSFASCQSWSLPF